MTVEMSDVPEAKRYEARGRRCGSSLRCADLPRLRKQCNPGRLSACCGPPSCPRPAATAITCCTGPPGAAHTSTGQPRHTAAGTTSPRPRRRDKASMIKSYSCRD